MLNNYQFVPTATASPSRILLTVRQFVERHPFVTEGGVRFQIFKRLENGLEKSGALIRLGRKILIDENKYFDWIDGQQKSGEEVVHDR